MKITPEQALFGLASLPHDQPIRPNHPQKNLARAVTEASEVDALLEEISITAETNLTPTQ